ncbi:receptor-like protein kinase 7 [Punica granatum]|uniref:non-specific serine/threonine protein kinase n=2 Tax=Punica granatum TaxID=22663 RepID=A0A218X730_PUNGR|nr:receptor-like protein kinase 7 [Punica granatum]OWM80578.1 hypothetical protein CDL15_Pgr006608 [Punica granatum]PKI46970.1 hypothetical protein CRG98_032669 [Punica granatum]
MSASKPLRTRSLPLPLLCSLLCFFSVLRGEDQGERQILLNLTSTLESSNPNLFSSWANNKPLCEFSGVTCNVNGSVREIDLSNQQLRGLLSIESVCRLQSLEKLALGYNSLRGSVSTELRDCVKLQYLDLGNNFFSGPFPDISSLSGLRYLYLNGSGFSGSFPWVSLRNVSDLVVLSIGDNPFDKTPFPKEILGLLNLNWIYMSNCSIEGEIPSAIGGLKNLGSLELSENYLTGAIPPEIVNLDNLWRLELYGNGLTGKIPVGFGNLTKLEYFDASMNSLEGDLSELRSLENLISLQLFMNNFSGEVPQELGEFKKLTNVSLYQNRLTGTLPQSLGSWAEFIYLDVSENFLTGPIPPDMCKQGTMKELLMLQNNFSDEIPESYARCTSLTRFRVSNNSLSGTVPSGIWGLPHVNIIDIELNQLVGPITSDIANAKALGELRIGNNQLSGELPPEIAKTESLVTIDLRNNRISGKIPDAIGDLKKLSTLHLQNNLLSGSIPESIGSCVKLSDLNIARNSLSGKIPSSLGNLPTLYSLNLSNNRLSGQIPSSLSSLRLSLLDLSNNLLSGPIPQSLSVDAYNGSFAGNPGVCSSIIGLGSFPKCSSNSGISKDVMALIVCFALSIVLLLGLLVIFLYQHKRGKSHERSLKDGSWDVRSFHVLTFTEDEILDSIKQENLIGKGGSGNVYKVVLSSGKELAVKHIWNSAEPLQPKKVQSTSPMLGGKRAQKSREFDAEVQTLSSIRHVNVVKLYCSITSEDSSLLVYEYLPNGSLWDKLHTGSKAGQLDWNTRYEIGLGAARGLEYLHHGCEQPVIHRDVKSSNILLDEFLKPRIADFGLAKVVQTGRGGDFTRVVAGTHGYIAPEYGYTCKVDEKSDVYSFGVVLMELVTGKGPIEPEFGENKDIVNWISAKLKNRENSVLDLVDPKIPGVLREEAVRVLRIAVICTERLPALRPTMRSVVQMLEDAEPCMLGEVVIEKVSGMSRASSVKESSDS